MLHSSEECSCQTLSALSGYTLSARLARYASPSCLGEPQPVVFSVHGAITEHYKVNPASIAEPLASTLNYVVAATAVVATSSPSVQRGWS